jgi:thiosulfate dehydrogenase
MRKFIFGLVVGLVLVPLMGFLYFATGMAPVATSDPMMPFEHSMAAMALHARIDKEMPKSVPIPADEATFEAGARVYMHHCAICHGALGQPESAIASGMFPPPPQLLPPHHGVTDDPPGETYWKVKNGIRLTGMPAFQGSLMDGEEWQVSLLLANADKISESVKKDLAFAPPPAPPAPSAAPQSKKK